MAEVAKHDPIPRDRIGSKDSDGVAAGVQPALKPVDSRASWLFNSLLYPGFANTSVFALSMGLTYLSDRGHDFAHLDNVFGRTARGLAWRTAKMDGWLMERGLSQDAARGLRMVATSFADGCAITPFVAYGESHLRRPFVQWYDQHFGTDSSQAEAEGPKQTLGSIVGGRLAACSIVVPTAYALAKYDITKKSSFLGIPIKPETIRAKQEKVFDLFTRNGVYDERRNAAPAAAAAAAEKEWNDLVTYRGKLSAQASGFLAEHFGDAEKEKQVANWTARNLKNILADIPKTASDVTISPNDWMFNIPGYHLGDKLAKSERPLAKTLVGAAHRYNLKVPKIAEFGIFELFYTTVCTTGLWLGSRAIAHLGHGNEKPGNVVVKPTLVELPKAANLNLTAAERQAVEPSAANVTRFDPADQKKALPEPTTHAERAKNRRAEQAETAVAL